MLERVDPKLSRNPQIFRDDFDRETFLASLSRMFLEKPFFDFQFRGLAQE